MLEIASACSCFLGEGPVWDTRNQVICWIDVLKGKIYELEPETKYLKTITVNQPVGSIVVCEDGSFLGAFQNGFGFVDRNTGLVDFFSDPEAHLPLNRFNDGKCDPAGRFWAGTMSMTERPSAGSVYMLDSDLSVSRKIEGTTISNGMAWSPDRRKFYFIDSPTAKVVAYNYELSSGSLSGREPVITFRDSDGFPDGMTIDGEGMLWIAHWNGWQVSRWNPVTGEKLFSIPLPVANVSSCTFGGSDLQDLYITTARKDLSAAEIKEQPLAGSLFVWKNCGYTGMPAFEYKK
ncbi:Sugar lactone lactonase YvrE [Mucilaginibacter pineti]|uniref:Sugar lactone lactonase YvrE n=1 Tax=Mucilaginibacter pineti TaxID=1391627 RepID=A0A1G7M584_9SPHI|nr:SMP-30/gluconolactonase/LRE family protein [Mucilaginibacter pineti]SDF56937.1 Sugar lactone lactonase YvrE [Mucilaginibacter pineti]